MNYVLTGSLGHISKPLAEKLIKAGHNVTIITSSQSHKKDIESLGGKAAVGSVDDPQFITKAFQGADMVYLMIPPKWDISNWIDYMKKVADIYVQAIKKNNIKKVVQLSSVGAHMKKGAGPVDGLAYLEEQLKAIPDLDAIFLRPSYFYYNTFNMIPMIQHMNIMGSNQPEDETIYLTHTNDIADAAAEEMLNAKFKGKEVKYIISDKRTWKEVTDVLSNSIGKKDVKWVEFSDEEALNGMLQSGLNKAIAEEYVKMGKAMRNGEFQADIKQRGPVKMGKIKLEDFSKEFAQTYKKK